MQKCKKSTTSCKVRTLENQLLRLIHIVTRGGSTICLITISMKRLVHLRKIWKVHQQLALTCHQSSLARPKPVIKFTYLSKLNFRSQTLLTNRVMSKIKFLRLMKSKLLLIKTTGFKRSNHNKFIKGKVLSLQMAINMKLLSQLMLRVSLKRMLSQVLIQSQEFLARASILTFRIQIICYNSIIIATCKI